MSNTSAMKQAKINRVLDKKMSFDEGVMTRREWLLLKVQQGVSVSVDQVSSVAYSRQKYNGMNAGEQAKYEEKLAKTKTEFSLCQGSISWKITKTEYDFLVANGVLHITDSLS